MVQPMRSRRAQPINECSHTTEDFVARKLKTCVGGTSVAESIASLAELDDFDELVHEARLQGQVAQQAHGARELLQLPDDANLRHRILVFHAQIVQNLPEINNTLLFFSLSVNCKNIVKSLIL